MKTKGIIIVLIISVIFFTTCSKETESTGTVLITIDNQNLNNQADYFVKAGIVLLESNDGLLVDFDKSDISEGGMVEFDLIELNVGNYYVRYQFFLGNISSGDEKHKPFQIQAGEETIIKIIR